MARPQFLRHLDRTGDIYASRSSKTEALMLYQVKDDIQGFRIGAAICQIDFDPFQESEKVSERAYVGRKIG